MRFIAFRAVKTSSFHFILSVLLLFVASNDLVAQWQPAVHIRHRGTQRSVIFQTSVRNVIMAKSHGFDGVPRQVYDLDSIMTDTVPFRTMNGFTDNPYHLYGKSIQCDGNPALDYFDRTVRFNILTPQEDSLKLGSFVIYEYSDYDADGLTDVCIGSIQGLIILYGDSTLPLRQRTILRPRTRIDNPKFAMDYKFVYTMGSKLCVAGSGWAGGTFGPGVFGLYGISLDSLRTRPDTVTLEPIDVHRFDYKLAYDDSLGVWSFGLSRALHLISDTCWYFGEPNKRGGKMTRVTASGMKIVTVDSTVYSRDGKLNTPNQFFGEHSYSGHSDSYLRFHDTTLLQCFFDYPDTNLRYNRLLLVAVDDTPTVHLTRLDSIVWFNTKSCGIIYEAAMIPDLDGDGSKEVLMNRTVSESADSCINYFEIYLTTGKTISAYTEPQRMLLPQVTRTQGGWLVPRILCSYAPAFVPAYSVNGGLVGFLTASDYDASNYFIADPPNAMTGVVLTVFGTCSLRLQ
ncbi:hypothetical protein BH10BAC6_BH10BAC6_16160 [soil metagenome]